MLVGVDFDNTIVSYDRVFHSVAVEWGLVPPASPVSKESVRDALRAQGREDEWTLLQGYVYGPGMRLATPFPGVPEFLDRCRSGPVPAVIISHRTRWPYRGQRHDLHACAHAWLEEHGLEVEAHFELSREDKLARVGSAGCTHFIDDLPEFLTAPDFPAGVERVLFDPTGADRPRNGLPPSISHVGSWREITARLLGA
jgi:hypothetical protein